MTDEETAEAMAANRAMFDALGWAKPKEGEYLSMYRGYSEDQALLKPKAVEQPIQNGKPRFAPSSIPFAELLEDLMPGVDFATQVVQWNRVTGELYTEERAKAHWLYDQNFVSLARSRWEMGNDRIKRRDSREALEKELVCQAALLAVPPAQKESGLGVSLRDLLPELYSGKRAWSVWLKKYNLAMEKVYQSVDVVVSASEARDARTIIPATKRVAKSVGAAAGGKAALKKPELKRQQLPGKRDF